MLRDSRNQPPLERTCGVNAVRTLLRERGDEVKTIWVDEELAENFADVLRGAAKRRVAYHLEARSSLDKLVDSPHHEGIVVAALPRIYRSLRELHEAPERTLDLRFLDNPHNIGALLRTAGFLGFDAAILAPQIRLTATLARVAEGALDVLTLIRGEAQSLHAFQSWRAQIVTADHHSTCSLPEWRAQLPLILVMGHERSGVPDEVTRMSHVRVQIPGSARVESLNVSVAGGILMAHAMHSG